MASAEDVNASTTLAGRLGGLALGAGKTLGAVVGAGYIGVCALVYVFQRKLQYFPTKDAPPAVSSLPAVCRGIEDFSVRTEKSSMPRHTAGSELTAGGASFVGKYCSFRWNTYTKAHTPMYPAPTTAPRVLPAPSARPPSRPASVVDAFTSSAEAIGTVEGATGARERISRTDHAWRLVTHTVS